MKLKTFLFPPKRDSRFRRPIPQPIKEVLQVAETRAAALGHDHLGLNHLVLALLGGAAPTMEEDLRQKGVDVERIVERIELALGRGTDRKASEARSRFGTLPITSRTRSVVELVAGLDRSVRGSPRLLLLILLATELPPADILREEGLTLGAFDR